MTAPPVPDPTPAGELLPCGLPHREVVRRFIDHAEAGDRLFLEIHRRGNPECVVGYVASVGPRLVIIEYAGHSVPVPLDAIVRVTLMRRRRDGKPEPTGEPGAAPA